MVSRRRLATREELVGLLVGRQPDLDPAVVEEVIDALAELGVPVNGLVKVTVEKR